MIREALDEKYSYQIDEHGMVHLFRGEEDCQQYLTNPLLSAIFKIEALKKENEDLKEQVEQMKCCGNCQSVFDADGFCYLYNDGNDVKDEVYRAIKNFFEEGYKISELMN